MPEKELLTIREASELLGVSIDTLRRWDKTGKLPSVRAGKGTHRLYKKEALELFMNDLYALAQSWASSSYPTPPPADSYCQNSSVFQARLTKMETELSHIENINDIFPLLVAMSGEIGNNSFDHNLGNWPDIMGIFFAYDLNRRMIILADRGLGILATLKRVRPDLKNDSEALLMAFTEQVSGRAPESRGNGLKFVKQIISANPFSLNFLTGDAKLQMTAHDDQINISKAENYFRGCLALIKF